MIRLKIKNAYYKVLDSYTINESSREVKFSSLKIDFTNKGIVDLPLKYQEVQLLDLNDDYSVNEVIYTGYVNNFVLPKMKNRNEYRELEIDLISPLGMATLRTADAVGTYQLQTLVIRLIQPLIDDGYVLKALNIGNNQITVNYLNETIESSLNKLSNRFNFWWYIDKNKNIYINSIDYLMGLKPKLVYDNDNSIQGLIDVIPSIDATDYCNTINFTNVRVYTESFFIRYHDEEDNNIIIYEDYEPISEIEYLKNGDKVEFKFPIVLDKDALEKTINYSSSYSQNLILTIAKLENNIENIVLDIKVENNQLIIPNNVSIEDNYNDDNTWVLVRDAFFKNLIVGLQYNGNDIEIGSIVSATGLEWSKVKISDDVEINKNKGIISQSGIVEKQVDMNEQWKSYQELLDIANSYIKTNTSKVEQVKLTMDVDNNLEIGDTIRINKDYFLIDDTYIITDKMLSYENNVKTYYYTLRNTNILENYVDLFRASETEENTDKFINYINASSIQEGIKESYEVVVNED
jgi:hypothetical protein